MTSFYLLDNAQPNTQQWGYPRRGAKLSGTCILHTAECALDLDGPDTSAEGTANFINNRSDYGSYHVLVDSDSIIWMAPWEYETWQDSQTNPWAVGISAAVQAANWHTIPADRRDRIYRNMAAAAADFVKYMKDAYGITVPLKRISGAQARAGVPGFCAHGDSGVDRSDPGAAFDWALFFNYTAQALGGATTPKEPFTVGQYEDLNKKLDKIDKTTYNTWAGVWTGGTNVDGKKFNYGILPIVAHSQAQAAAQAAQTQAAIAALSNVIKQLGEATGTPVDLEAVTAAAEAGAAKALSGLEANVTIKQGV